MEKTLLYFSLLITAFTYINVCKADEKIGIYELKNGHISINITNYGATVLNVLVPDRNGKLDDIVLGFGSIDEYKNDSTYFGALVGRVANRIGGAQFTLNGHVYKLPANDHGNTLHGGSRGFGDVVWTVYDYVKHSHLTLTYDSHDGEQGFPGELSVTVKSHLSGYAYDFLEPRTIGSKFNELPDGYDINYVLDRTGAGKTFTKAATVRDDKSGRKMELWTDQAGVQFYTSNMLGDTVGKDGFVYKKYGGFCLETQGFPDSVNHRNFPSQIVNPGDSYRHVMVYRFTAS
ncbi:hypothetical protein DH2020_048288 [Rehmannia glutinosa]|uniref:Aldose 1-epimerase n=1 Tax=Rehmannia glutinosa TaxID=99300 RepID=A0ABR0U628_REHGL